MLEDSYSHLPSPLCLFIVASPMVQDWKTPLMLAAEGGNLEEMNSLVDSEISIDEQDMVEDFFSFHFLCS